MKFIWIVLVFVLSSRAGHLPQELVWPRQTAPEDTCRLRVNSEQSLFDKTFTSTDNLVYRPVSGPYEIEQGLWYELRRDRLRNHRHYVNASGEVYRSLSSLPWIKPGFDWIPVTQVYKWNKGVNTLMTLDAGPSVIFDLKGIPLNVRAGLSGRRIDSLASWRNGDHRSSVGAYGSFRLGAFNSVLPFAPLYFQLEGVGRSIENSAMASISGSALSAFTIGPQDSVFVYGDASLFNGKEGYLEESADSRSSYFSRTPWRIEQNLNFTAGFKGRKRLLFYPSLYYSWEKKQRVFPTDDRKRDEKTARHTLSASASTDTAANLSYRGTLSFDWREHDKLFKRVLPEKANESNVDSLKLNLWDHVGFSPRTNHRLQLRLPYSASLIYDLTLYRVLTEYPNFFIDEGKKVTNIDDNDRLTKTHRVTLAYGGGQVSGELFGEMTEYTLVYLRRAKSSSNRTDQEQKVGLALEWTPNEKVYLSESVLAEAKKGEFHFSDLHQESVERPPYSRALSSDLTGALLLLPELQIKGSWSIKYSDYGFWYGRDYMDAALAQDSTSRVDYYAITSKSIYYTVDLGILFQHKALSAEVGNAFTDTYDRFFQSGNYIVTNDKGYTTKPYCDLNYIISENLNISSHVSYTFVVGRSASGYWDFRMQVEGQL
ncbi:MAG: hypothetical protein ACLFQB_10270 [Chitinispirillaceae bacterium]